MLDNAANNAWVFYRKSTNKGITRRNFLQKVIDALRHEQVESSPKILTAAYNQPPSRKCKKC